MPRIRTLSQPPLLFAAYCFLLLCNKLTKFSNLNRQIFVISQFLWGRHLETAHLAASGLGFSWGYSQAVGHGCCPLTTCLGVEKPLPWWLSDGSRSLLLAIDGPCGCSNTPTDFRKTSDSRESKAEAMCLSWSSPRVKHHNFGHSLSFKMSH